MIGPRTKAADFAHERFTMDDSLRHPDDPIRKGDGDLCCHEHVPGRVCILPAGHR